MKPLLYSNQARQSRQSNPIDRDLVFVAIGPQVFDWGCNAANRCTLVGLPAGALPEHFDWSVLADADVASVLGASDVGPHYLQRIVSCLHSVGVNHVGAVINGTLNRWKR